MRNLRLEGTSITAICQEGAKLEKTADWKESVCKPAKVDIDCRPTSYNYIYEVPNMIKQEKYIMHNCQHNEFVGLRNRYLKETKNSVTYDKSIVDGILDELCTQFKPHWEGALSLKEFMDGKTGPLYQRYSDAIDKINTKGFNIDKHSGTSAFVKNELYDEVKPPRMIINRDTRFNLAYGRYTSALEHCMVKIPQFSKGLNYLQRGIQFQDLVYFPGCDILEGDASKFEATQRPELLEHIELGIWKRILDDHDYNEISRLFYAKMKKQGVTQNGVEFSFIGCRGSGDMDTGLFNSILMWIACRYFEIFNKFTWKGCFIVDGDDNGIRIPKGKTYIDTFAHFGFDAKLIIRDDYHDFDYCSGKFIKINANTFMYVQNIVKIINNMSVFRKIKFQHCKADYYHSLGYMYKQIYGDLPMFSEFSKFLLRSTKGHHVKVDILRELNPTYVEAFKSSTSIVGMADATIEIELCMSFGLTPGYLQYIRNHFNDAYIKFEDGESRKYRCIRKQRERVSEIDFIKCETLIQR